MSWKDDIGSYFGDQGVFRLKHLNQNLKEYLTEWKNYMCEFDDLHVDLSHEYLVRNYKPYTSYWLRVKNNNYDMTFRFHLNVSYCPSEESSEYCLYMNWTKHLNLGTMDDIIKNCRLEPDDEMNFKWEKAEFFGAEICEKEFVLQLINNRVKNYFSHSLSIKPKE